MRKTLRWMIPLLAMALLSVSFLIYTGNYSRADETALSALKSDEAVSVSKTSCGWFFDGPATDSALIFYPGGKVEETAYAPLLHRLAGEGLDVFLVKMPFRLAVFGADKATGILSEYEYERWYIGGHSLGGAMAANYAAEHGDSLTGLFLLAAYPTKELPKDLLEISIYGSEDGVVNRHLVEEGKGYAPDRMTEHIIIGGNHAGFGNYGEQKGDGRAAISAEKQQAETVEVILAEIRTAG